MLKEVSQTTLTFIFLNRTHTLSDVEVDMVLRIVVVTHIISESVCELASAESGIGRHIRHSLCEANRSHEGKRKRE